MNIRKRVALVVILVASAVIPGAQFVRAAPHTHPITVVHHAYPLSYWKDVAACMADNTDQEQIRCQKIVPDTGARCTRVEEWYADNTFRVVKNDCGY